MKQDIVKYACDKCEYEGENQSVLEVHEDTQHRGSNLENTFSCCNCDFITIEELQLKVHNQIVHMSPKIDLDVQKNVINPELLSCEQCEYVCKLNKQMQNHVKAKHIETEETMKYKCLRNIQVTMWNSTLELPRMQY